MLGRTRPTCHRRRPQPLADSQLQIGPVSLVLGRPVPLRAQASLSLSGYQVAVRGDAGLKQLLQSARLLGIPVPAVAADGSSTLDLTLAGSWSSSHATQGSRHRAVALGAGASTRAECADEHRQRQPGPECRLGARAESERHRGASATWRGPCKSHALCSRPPLARSSSACKPPSLTQADLNALLNPSAKTQSWYKFLAARRKSAGLSAAGQRNRQNRGGQIAAGRSACHPAHSRRRFA